MAWSEALTAVTSIPLTLNQPFLNFPGQQPSAPSAIFSPDVVSRHCDLTAGLSLHPFLLCAQLAK